MGHQGTVCCDLLRHKPSHWHLQQSSSGVDDVAACIACLVCVVVGISRTYLPAPSLPSAVVGAACGIFRAELEQAVRKNTPSCNSDMKNLPSAGAHSRILLVGSAILSSDSSLGLKPLLHAVIAANAHPLSGDVQLACAPHNNNCMRIDLHIGASCTGAVQRLCGAAPAP